MASQYDANEWDRLIDQETQKPYWYNNYTGESIWVEDNHEEASHNNNNNNNSPNTNRVNLEMEMMNIPNSPPPIKNELEMALERKRSAERELENLRKMEEIESGNSTIEATNINEKKKEGK